MTQGVLIYAHNSNEVDYLKITCANALMVQYNLSVPVTLVTDKVTLESADESLIKKCFEKVILVEKNAEFRNLRKYTDHTSVPVPLQFYNCAHWNAYNLTPYDETLFIDSDYLIMSDALSACWGASSEVLIDSRIYTPGSAAPPAATYITPAGIKQYWATVIYFRKSEFASCLFSTVKHVEDNYRYYRSLYDFENGIFRNDNAFSVAVHTLNNFVENNDTYLPIPGLLMSWDLDNVIDIPSVNTVRLLSETGIGKYQPVKITNTDIHIMNKWAASRVADNLIELYS